MEAFRSWEAWNLSASKTILLVEDNPDDVTLLQWALRKHGLTYPIQVVEHGAQAVQYLSGAGEFGDREKYPLPHLIVLDLNLPEMNGVTFLKWLRNKSPIAPCRRWF